MRGLLAIGSALWLCVALTGMPALGQDPSVAPVGRATEGLDGQAISDLVMAAWATGRQDDIDAIYHPDVMLRVDATASAVGRDELTERILDRLEAGDSLRQVGPVIESRRPSGLLVVGTITEVLSGERPRLLLVCYYGVTDGLVRDHSCLIARGLDSQDTAG